MSMTPAGHTNVHSSTVYSVGPICVLYTHAVRRGSARGRAGGGRALLIDASIPASGLVIDSVRGLRGAATLRLRGPARSIAAGVCRALVGAPSCRCVASGGAVWRHPPTRSLARPAIVRRRECRRHGRRTLCCTSAGQRRHEGGVRARACVHWVRRSVLRRARCVVPLCGRRGVGCLVIQIQIYSKEVHKTWLFIPSRHM